MSKGKSKQKTDNSIDPWSQNQFQNQQTRIRGILDEGYGGSLGASELSDYETQGGDLINQFVGSYGEGLGQSRDLINSTTFTPGTMSPQNFSDFDADVYVNPHSDALISQTTGDIQEAADRTANSIKADNLAQGAYGGSRHGVREALLDESMLDSIADMSAQTRFDVWNQGADRFYTDVGNQMTADAYNADQINQGAQFDLTRAGMLSDLVGQERSFEQQDIDRLMGLGATERQVQDSHAAREYDEYWRTIQAEMGLLGSIPIIQDGESSNSYTPGTLDYINTGANIAGLFMGG
jgi:hypothetical protein